jgi:hypothetical protein
MSAKRGRNSATAVLMRLLLATRGDCRRRVAYPGTSIKPSIPVQTWRGQAGCAQSSPVGGTDMAQFAINSGEPGQAAEAVCRLHAACGTRRHQWQYLGISVGWAGVLVHLFNLSSKSDGGLAGTSSFASGPARPAAARG